MKILTLSGPIVADETARAIRAGLTAAAGAPVRLDINSPGGSVFEALEIADLLEAYRGAIEARVVGLAASAASYILTAARRVTVGPRSVIMLHNAAMGAMGDQHDLRDAADLVERFSGILADGYARKTGRPLEQVKEDLDAETWLFGREALAYGIADDYDDQAAPDLAGRATAFMDRAGAIASARAAVAACHATEPGDALRRMAARLDSQAPDPTRQRVAGELLRLGYPVSLLSEPAAMAAAFDWIAAGVSAEDRDIALSLGLSVREYLDAESLRRKPT